MSLCVTALVRESDEVSSSALVVEFEVWSRSLRRMRKMRLWR